MSTDFYWDEEKTKIICTRKGSECYGRNLVFIFYSVETLISFLNADRKTIIYSEYDEVLTVDMLRRQVLNKGAIVIEEE